jgi:hypothetical protein
MPVQRAGAGVCARRRSNFLLSRQEKVTKEKATLLRASPSLRYGATCDARSGSATAELAARLRRSARTTAVSQFTKCVCPAAHACTPCPALLGTHRREPEKRTSTRAIAALGPVCAARGACARKVGPSAAMARVDVRLLDVRLSTPLLDAPAAGRLRGEHGRRSAHASLTDSPWLSERRAPAQSEFHGAPRNRPGAGRPFAPRRGRRLGVAFSLVTFFWRSKRKLLARRATPGLRPQPKHALQTSTPRFRQAQPERVGGMRMCPGFDRLSPNGFREDLALQKQ